MAKQTITVLTDDIDGGEADETLTFGFDGHIYEIDLSSENAELFRESMKRYVLSGTRKARISPTGAIMGTHGVQRNRSGVEHPAFEANRELNGQIRRWAVNNGYSLAERGRIPQHIVDAFHKGLPAPRMLSAPELPMPDGDEAAPKKTVPAKKGTAPAAARTRRAARA